MRSLKIKAPQHHITGYWEASTNGICSIAVIQMRLELMTYRLGGGCSVQLSY